MISDTNIFLRLNRNSTYDTINLCSYEEQSQFNIDIENYIKFPSILNGDSIGFITNKNQISNISKETPVYINNFIDNSYYSLETIKHLLANIKDKNIKDLLETKQDIENNKKFSKLIPKLLRNKRKKVNNCPNGHNDGENNSCQVSEKSRKKRGRKIKDNKRRVDFEHTKFTNDNISKKAKGKLIKYCLRFLNKILGMYGEKKLLPINYKTFVNETSQSLNLKLMSSTLREIFSTQITPKNKTKNENYNKEIIDNIFNKKEENDYNSNIIKFALNMTFEDFCDIFLCKKNINNLMFDDNQTVETIEGCANELEEMLKEVYQKNKNKNYFLEFIYMLYNLQRYFFIKSPRIKKSKKKEKKEKDKTQ